MRLGVLWVGLGLCLSFGAVGIFFSTTGTAADVHPDFQSTWERTDRPVSNGDVHRTWMWGPGAHTDAFYEPYEDAPGGERLVQYFDKSRMEIIDPSGDSNNLWHVTNGLLALELITGNMQTGDATFEQRQPADVQIAGDAHPESPTYATFGTVLNEPQQQEGQTITQTLSHDGTVGDDPAAAHYSVEALHPVHDVEHAVASVFWNFMNSSGDVYADGSIRHDQLFPNPFFGVGFPVTGAYWIHVPVDGVWQDVLAQCFERRCLTYTPANPAGWQVEAGNIGQHYYEWRYESDAEGSAEDDLTRLVPAEEELGPPVPGACEAPSQAVLTVVTDSLGNANPSSWASGTGGDWPGGIESSPHVDVGQDMTYMIEAEGECGPLEYRVQRYRPNVEVSVIRNWSEDPQFSYTFESEDVGDFLMLIVDVRNQDPRNRFDDRDDYTYLTYIIE